MKKSSYTIIFFLFSLQINAQSIWHKILLPTNENLNEITFINDSIGFIAGDQGTLLKTKNAGQTWVELNTLGTTDEVLSVAFLNEMEGIVTLKTTNQNTLLQKTTDGGNTWSAPLAAQGVFPGGFCFPKTVYSRGNRIFMGGNGCFYGDGIQIYENDSIISDTILNSGFFNSSINNFYFITDSIGFACSGNGRIYKTTTAGDSWEAIIYGNGSAFFYDIAFENEFLGYAVANDTTGDFGSSSPDVILKTEDGGNTWEPLLGGLFVTPTLTDIEIYSKDSIITVGDYSDLTPNSGTVWYNFNDTNPQWFAQWWDIDTLNDEPVFNDVIANNGCLYLAGDSGSLYILCIDSNTSFEQPNQIVQIDNEGLIKIYPNPVSDKLNFEFDLSKTTLLVEIYTSYGEIIVKERITQNQQSIDLANIKTGIYYLRIIDKEDSKEYSKKFIKK